MLGPSPVKISPCASLQKLKKKRHFNIFHTKILYWIDWYTIAIATIVSVQLWIQPSFPYFTELVCVQRSSREPPLPTTQTCVPQRLQATSSRSQCLLPGEHLFIQTIDKVFKYRVPLWKCFNKLRDHCLFISDFAIPRDFLICANNHRVSSPHEDFSYHATRIQQHRYLGRGNNFTNYGSTMSFTTITLFAHTIYLSKSQKFQCQNHKY